MSIKSSGSTLTEVPGVAGAVDRLQELGYRMKSDDFGFGDKDVDNVDKVIEALHELETEVRKLHEKLETETIHASIYRHKLIFLPEQVKAEIQAAVDSARQSNAEEIQRLQNQLNTINTNTEEAETLHQELEKENAVLHPERDKVRSVHEEIIAQLNQRMAEKASKQIVLNETRDRLRETNQKIVDLEEGIIQLKEDLIQERADARMEKKRLKKAVYDTSIKTKEQKEVNVEKKIELDDLQEKVTKSEAELNKIRKSIRTYETSRSRLEATERLLSSQLQKEVQQNSDLSKKGLDLASELNRQLIHYDNRKEELEAIVVDLDTKLFKEGENNDELEIKKINLESSLREKLKVRKADAATVQQENTQLQAAKSDLANKAEDVARLHQENEDMEQRMKELGETHEAIIATLKKQIEECRESLTKERKERLELQEESETAQKGMDDFKFELTKEVNDMNESIKEGKKQHDELTREGSQLQQSIKKGDDEYRNMKVELKAARERFEQLKNMKEQEVETMQNEIVYMEESQREKTAIVEEKEPPFRELEEFFVEREQSYEETKKNLIALKNKKLGLEDQMKRFKKSIEKLDPENDKYNKQLKDARKQFLEDMKKHTVEVKEKETEIYETGCRLRAVMDENDRFSQANKGLEDEIAHLTKQLKDSVGFIKNLEGEQGHLKGELNQDWNNDNEMERLFAARDQGVVNSLDELLKKTEKREDVISDITTKLEGELLMLAKFLENVAKRRPKESKPNTPKSRAGSRAASRADRKSPRTPRQQSKVEVTTISPPTPAPPAERLKTPNTQLRPISRQKSSGEPGKRVNIVEKPTIVTPRPPIQDPVDIVLAVNTPEASFISEKPSPRPPSTPKGKKNVNVSYIS